MLYFSPRYVDFKFYFGLSIFGSNFIYIWLRRLQILFEGGRPIGAKINLRIS